MSYDWYMIDNMCPTCGRGDDVGEELNYTYNVGPMFREALKGSWYDDFNGKSGGELLPIVTAGIADMEARHEFYEAMNPPNGWGNYEGALKVLRTIQRWCKEHPSATLKVS